MHYRQGSSRDLVWNMIKDLQAQGFVTAALIIPVVCPSMRVAEWME